MTSLSSTYLIPAVLLNPIVILHGFNTFCSSFVSTTLPSSTSNHQWLENLGPAAAPGPYFDVHNSDQLCWAYTLLMVVVQVLGYFKVNDTRVRKKSARAAAKAERERRAAQKEKLATSESCISATTNGHMLDSERPKDIRHALSGHSIAVDDIGVASNNTENLQNIEDSTIETSSEEEMMV